MRRALRRLRRSVLEAAFDLLCIVALGCGGLAWLIWRAIEGVRRNA